MLWRFQLYKCCGFRVGRVTMAIGSPAGFLARVAVVSACGVALWCDVSAA